MMIGIVLLYSSCSTTATSDAMAACKMCSFRQGIGYRQSRQRSDFYLYFLYFLSAEKWRWEVKAREGRGLCRVQARSLALAG